MDLLKPRSRPSFGWIEAVALGLYTLLVGIVTSHHEPWSDEAQAWLIARDSSLTELFLKRLHYEGSPGLWHLLLWTLSRLHVSFTAMHWITALIGVVTAWLVLRYSPFPLLVRVALPFTFPFVFQTAIIARSYSLVPLLAFLICIVLTGRRDRPLTFAVLLGLLANTSLFALVEAIGILPLYFLGPAATKPPGSRRRLAGPATALALLFLCAMYTALPATDINYGPGRGFALHKHIAHVVGWITGSPSTAPPDPAVRVPQRPMPPEPNKVLLAEHFGSHLFLGHQFIRVLGILSIAFYTVSQFNVLAILFYALFLLWQRSHRALITSLPLLFILVGGQYLGVGDHHTSLVAVGLVIALWLTWSNIHPPDSKPLDHVFQLVLLAVLIEQVAWTAHASLFDIRQPFDGSVSAAQYIIPQAAHHRVASIGIDDIAVQPYAPHNIFYNQRTTYWPWRIGFNPSERIVETVAQHPDFIMDSEAYLGDTLVYNQLIPEARPGQIFSPEDTPTYFGQHGYHETHRFCGWQPAHFGFSRETCLVVYGPSR